VRPEASFYSRRMRRPRALVGVLTIAATIAAVACGSGADTRSRAAVPAGPTGTIRGVVRLNGTPPPNPPIRMRADPMCDEANGGRTVPYESVVTGPDGGLANVFVSLDGTFPNAPPPAPQPVLVDQIACLYTPRVVGLQLGRTLRIRNSDPGLHNVHGASETIEGFNIGQPSAGITNDITPRAEGLLRLQCDVHAWMVAFVHVVSHPYFDVTGRDGAFEIRGVPAGVYTIRSWHEKYGELTSSVSVETNQATEVALTYTAE
jgi:plastocyanin